MSLYPNIFSASFKEWILSSSLSMFRWTEERRLSVTPIWNGQKWNQSLTISLHCNVFINFFLLSVTLYRNKSKFSFLTAYETRTLYLLLYCCGKVANNAHFIKFLLFPCWYAELGKRSLIKKKMFLFRDSAVWRGLGFCAPTPILEVSGPNKLS